MEEPRHCDDYIEDPAVPECVRTWLNWARSPAHGLMLPKPHPTLFADFGKERVRVTMASRFGSIGINPDLTAEAGYRETVHLADLTNFGTEP